MTIGILRGDARHLPLPDGSVDVVLGSPPYYSLRDYRDGGESLAGQIGAEATPREYIEALLECTREWARVLKPTGSMFVVLGDKYAGGGGGNYGSGKSVKGREGAHLTNVSNRKAWLDAAGAQSKSLLGLPWRYALACIDDLDLIWRAEIVWEKGNGLPESTRDRVIRGHEVILELSGDDGEFDTMLHFTRQGRYYFGTDLIREHQLGVVRGRLQAPGGWERGDHLNYELSRAGEHPLGKLPRSVWRIPSAPLNVPERLEHARCCGGKKRPGCQDGLDHHAAYPPELARRVILGWSPAGICLECREGRWPVAVPTGETGRHPAGGGTYRAMKAPGAKDTNLADAALRYRRIVGYACACTPYTDHPERRRPSVTPSRELRQDQDTRVAVGESRHHGDDWPARLPVREYDLEGWTPPPTRPAVVLDPFAGTGTTLLVADVLGRHAIGVELSADYCGLARWRTTDPGERARAMQVPRPPIIPDGQDSLFDVGEAVS